MIVCRPNFNEKQVCENEKFFASNIPYSFWLTGTKYYWISLVNLGYFIVRFCALEPLLSSSTLGHVKVWVLHPVRKIISFDICDINMVGTVKGSCVHLPRKLRYHKKTEISFVNPHRDTPYFANIWWHLCLNHCERIYISHICGKFCKLRRHWLYFRYKPRYPYFTFMSFVSNAPYCCITFSFLFISN